MNSPESNTENVPSFLFASNRIMREETFKLYSTEVREIPVLAEGYALFTNCKELDPAALVRQLLPILHVNKTIVLTDTNAAVIIAVRDTLQAFPGIRMLALASEHTYQIAPGTSFHTEHLDEPIVFLVSNTLLMRRYLHQRVQRRNIVFSGQDRLPIQLVTFVGLGPTPELVSTHAREMIRTSKHVVLFDRTLSNIVGKLAFGGERYVIHYNYEVFSANLLAMNLMLGSLHASGVLDPVVLIEGNPEVYDFAEGLSTAGREFSFEPTEPLVALGCRWVEKQYALDFVMPSYVLTSGCNVRHGIATASAIKEIASVMGTELTCMAMEMYIGDIPLVLSEVRRATRRKSVIVLTNMYSPLQRVFFLPFERLGDIEWVELIKGQFTTLVIVDESRLPIGSGVYNRLSAEIGPPGAPVTSALSQGDVPAK